MRFNKVICRFASDSRVWRLFSYAIFTVTLFYVFEMTADDSWISFRYARNLANGYGLVFNPGGEHVEGYTNFLWLIIITIFIKSGVHPLVGAKLLSVLLAYLTMGMLGRIARQSPLPSPYWRFIPIALVGMLLPYAIWSVSGMESGLTAFLLVALVAVDANWQGRRRQAGLGILLLLLLCNRLDGALAFVVIVASAWHAARQDGFRSWRSHARDAALMLGPTALIFIPYLAWKLTYYGSLLPNTYYAKVAGIPLLAHLFSGVSYTAEFAVYWAGIPIFILALYLVLGGRLHRTLANGLALLAVYVVYILFVGGDVLPCSRMFAPLIPLIALTSVLCLGGLVSQWGLGELRQILSAGMFLGLTGLSCFGSTLLNQIPAKASFDLAAKLTIDAGIDGAFPNWLRNYGPPGSSIALFSAGYLPYATDFYTIDRIGLNDTYIAHHGVRDDNGADPQFKTTLDYWLPLQPTFIETWLDLRSFQQGITHSDYSREDELLLQQPLFLENYVLLTGIEYPFAFFQRRDTVDAGCLENVPSIPTPVCQVDRIQASQAGSDSASSPE